MTTLYLGPRPFQTAREFLLALISASVAPLVFATLLQAQEVTGNIAGTVTDASGSVVPGATVIVTNTDTNQARTMKTGANGDYSATLLPIGHYSIAVESAGFKRVNKTGIELNVNDRLT